YKELAGRDTDLIDVSELRAGYNN
ncbi:MAG: hypothetical protein RIS36_488, partial [Pseudomonadota bacterium]